MKQSGEKKVILEKRKEIEKDLLKHIKKTKSNATLDLIKEIIYEEKGSSDMQDIIAFFDDGNMEHLDTVLEVVSDAWNYFPHRALGGKCPQEIMSEDHFEEMQDIQTKGVPQFTEDDMEDMVENVFREIYDLARKRATQAFKKIGGTTEEFKVLERELINLQKPGNTFLTDLCFKLLERDHDLIPESLDGFMREYQAMDNHRVIEEGQKGIFSSPFLWNVFHALGSKKEQMSFPIPIFMIAVLTAHHMIDEYASNYKLKSEVSGVAHHVFDWMSLTNPLSVHRRSIQQSVALAYGVVRMVEGAVFNTQGFVQNEDLVQYGDFKKEEFIALLKFTFLEVVCAVEDPHMLCVNGVNVPEDWFARLKKTAPELKDKTYNMGQPIPSPWMI
ncbi:MAG: hypothetical protein NTV02_00045 [Candidatus Zambryskibacteria bacterium]|nr:hypothetical protein [Candidatus Zambryskibacteria bacterium]